MAKTLADLYMMHPVNALANFAKLQIGQVTPPDKTPDKPDKPDPLNPDPRGPDDPNYDWHSHGSALGTFRPGRTVAQGAPATTFSPLSVSYGAPGLSLAALFGYGR